MNPNRNSVSLFTVKKKHAWREQLVRLIGFGLVLVVLLGTGIWLLMSANLSLGGFLSKQLQKLRPEVKQEEVKKATTKAEELQTLIADNKVLEVQSLTMTAEGDLLLQSKSGTVVIFAVKKSLTDQVATLQTLLTKAKIDSKALKKVDFRFEKVVVE